MTLADGDHRVTSPAAALWACIEMLAVDDIQDTIRGMLVALSQLAATGGIPPDEIECPYEECDLPPDLTVDHARKTVIPGLPDDQRDDDAQDPS